MFVLDYKKRQLPFHKKESKYYRLQAVSDVIDIYVHLYQSVVQGIKQFAEIPPPNGYNTKSFYYIFHKHVCNASPSESMDTPGLYAQKIGKKWYIYIKGVEECLV
jgi:hypothetical protein